MAKSVNLKINGVSVTVPEKTVIVDAAKMAGIDIPVFCYHPKMEPVGMCRQCLVEIGRPMVDRATGQALLEEDGSPKIQFGPKLETSCTTPVTEGMVIITNSEKARNGQREILEFLLTNHPLDCPICDKGGECPLQNLTMAYGPDKSRYLLEEKQHLAKHYPLGELIVLDRERCVQCARCIRFQDKIAGEPVLDFYNRGRAIEIVTYSEPGFDSIFSGNTTDICPVGALTSADFRFAARPWELKNAASICTQCPVGCNITFNVRREAKIGGGYAIKRVMPRQNEQVNEIWMCDKGRFAGYHYTEASTRLKLEPAKFDAAIASAADKLKAAGSDAAILVGGRLANEDLFNLKQLAAGLGAKTILYTAMGGGEYTTAYGLTANSNLGTIGKGDTVLVVASDLYNEAPIWHLRLKAAAERGATLIVAAAHETKLDEFASFVIHYSYGDEIEMVNGIVNKEKVGDATKNANNLVIFYGSDGLGLSGTSALAAACADLLEKRIAGNGSETGKTDERSRANNGLIGVWQTPNMQGALEMGFRPSFDLASELKGKTVYVVAADPAGDDPKLAEALKAAKTVIAQDILVTATTEIAEIVLPAAAYTEREGTYTSGERRVQRFYPAVPSRTGTRVDFSIVADIAKRFGIELEGRSALLVMNKIAAAEPAFAGTTYDKLSEVTPQWPIVGRGDMYYGGTGYENTQGLGAHLALDSKVSRLLSDQRQETLDSKALRPTEGELIAVPVTKLYDMGTNCVQAKLLEKRIGEPTVVVNPATAEKFGLLNGSKATVSLNGVDAEVNVSFDASVSTGVVLVRRSFGIPISEPVKVELKVRV